MRVWLSLRTGLSFTGIVGPSFQVFASRIFMRTCWTFSLRSDASAYLVNHLEDITTIAMSAPCYEAEEGEVHMAAISRNGQLLMWVSGPTARARL